MEPGRQTGTLACHPHLRYDKHCEPGDAPDLLTIVSPVTGTPSQRPINNCGKTQTVIDKNIPTPGVRSEANKGRGKCRLREESVDRKLHRNDRAVVIWRRGLWHSDYKCVSGFNQTYVIVSEEIETIKKKQTQPLLKTTTNSITVANTPDGIMSRTWRYSGSNDPREGVKETEIEKEVRKPPFRAGWHPSVSSPRNWGPKKRCRRIFEEIGLFSKFDENFQPPPKSAHWGKVLASLVWSSESIGQNWSKLVKQDKMLTVTTTLIGHTGRLLERLFTLERV